MRSIARRSVGAACFVAATLSVGCATTVVRGPIVASRYYGTWANANSHYHNWWAIDANGAVSYGSTQDGKCESGRAVILGPDLILIDFGDGIRGTFNLRLAGGEFLLFVSEDALRASGDPHITVSKRVDASAVCRKPDGTYSEGAPHVEHTFLDSRLYGSWANMNPRYYVWWEISAAGVIAYGLRPDGKCDSEGG